MSQIAIGSGELSSKVVLVTGGASGIGAAIARAFAFQGARLAVHSYQTPVDQVEAMTKELRQLGCEVLPLKADFSKQGQVADTVQRAAEHFSGLDILVNNAGGMVARRRLEELDGDFINLVFDLNARSALLASQAVLPYFTRQGGGNIINLSSISATTGGSPGSSVYSAAKGFVSTLTRSLARELAERNIRVNAISPGTVATSFHQRFSNPEKLEKTRVGIPLQRLGLAEDCAGTAIYLASDSLSGYVTGQVIEVNGGQLMG